MSASVTEIPEVAMEFHTEQIKIKEIVQNLY